MPELYTEITLNQEQYDELPPDVRKLYDAEGEGDDVSYSLTGVRGMKTGDDVSKLDKSLKAARNDFRQARDELRAYESNLDGIEFEDNLEGAERLTWLREQYDDAKQALADGGGDPSEDTIKERVERSLEAKLRPVKRERDKLKEERDRLEQERDSAQTQLVHRDITDEARSTAISTDVAMKKKPVASRDFERFVVDNFIRDEDGDVVTRQGGEFAEGLTLKEALVEMRSSGDRDYWFEDTQSAGLNGGGGAPKVKLSENPFRPDPTNPSGNKPAEFSAAVELCKSDPSLARRMLDQVIVPGKYDPSKLFPQLRSGRSRV